MLGRQLRIQQDREAWGRARDVPRWNVVIVITKRCEKGREFTEGVLGIFARDFSRISSLLPQSAVLTNVNQP